MAWGEFKTTSANRVKICDNVNIKVHDSRCLFVNVNKCSVPTIVPEQLESASIVTLVEINSVDVPATSNQNTTVLAPTTGTSQGPNVIVVDLKIASDSGSNSHT